MGMAEPKSSCKIPTARLLDEACDIRADLDELARLVVSVPRHRNIPKILRGIHLRLLVPDEQLAPDIPVSPECRA